MYIYILLLGDFATYTCQNPNSDYHKKYIISQDYGKDSKSF